MHGVRYGCHAGAWLSFCGMFAPLPAGSSHQRLYPVWRVGRAAAVLLEPDKRSSFHAQTRLCLDYRLYAFFLAVYQLSACCRRVVQATRRCCLHLWCAAWNTLDACKSVQCATRPARFAVVSPPTAPATDNPPRQDRHTLMCRSFFLLGCFVAALLPEPRRCSGHTLVEGLQKFLVGAGLRHPGQHQFGAFVLAKHTHHTAQRPHLP